MKVTEAKFTRRYNVAQYEHEEYSLVAVVEDDDNAVKVLAQLKADVEAAHAGDVPLDDAGQDADETPEEKPPKKPSKKSKPAPTTTPDDESEDEEDDTEEDDGGDDEEETDTEETVEEDDEDEEDEKPGKKSATSGAKGKAKDTSKKTFKKKPQVYQRTNETHKDIFSSTLKAVAPKWKATPESKALAKKVSQKLEGVDFLDEDGNVLPSFKEQVRKGMLGKK